MGKPPAAQSGIQDRVAVAVCIAAVVFGSIFGIWVLRSGDYVDGSIRITFALLCAFLGFWITRRPGNRAPTTTVVVLACALFLYLYATGGVEGTGIMWGILIPAAAPFFLGFAPGLFLSLSYLLTVVVMALLPRQSLPLYHYHTATIARFAGVSLVTGFITLVYERTRIRDQARLEREIDQRTESEFRYQLLFDDSPDAYLVLSNGSITDCNHAAETMLGRDRLQIVGTTPAALSPPVQPDGHNSSEAARTVMAQVPQKGILRFAWVHRRLDGTDFWTEVSITSTPMHGRTVLLTCVRDIDARKRAEEQLTQLYAETERTNRLMNGREDRIIELKHEINTLCLAAGGPVRYPAAGDAP